MGGILREGSNGLGGRGAPGRQGKQHHIGAGLGIGFGQVSETVKRPVQKGESTGINAASGRLQRKLLEQAALEIKAVEGVAAAQPDAGITIQGDPRSQATAVSPLESRVDPHQLGPLDARVAEHPGILKTFGPQAAHRRDEERNGHPMLKTLFQYYKAVGQ